MAVQEKRRKVGAVLAGGLVLGVGAVLVMAAWNSSEFATGSFATGGFVLEGKTSAEADFKEHPDDKPANLDFILDTSNVSPGDKVTAGFAVRLTENTTFDGTAVINTEVANPVNGLSQRIYTSATSECNGTEMSEIVALSALETGADGTAFDLVQGAGNAAGEIVNLCFEVSAGDETAQNGTSAAVWTIIATQTK